MSLTLYPYVYLLARAAFVEQGSRTRDAARTLGAGRARTFFRVLLPARPPVAGRGPGAGHDGGAHRLRDRAVLRRPHGLGRGLLGLEGHLRLRLGGRSWHVRAAVRRRGARGGAADARPGPLHPAGRRPGEPPDPAPRLAGRAGDRGVPGDPRRRVLRARSDGWPAGPSSASPPTDSTPSTAASASTSPTPSFVAAIAAVTCCALAVLVGHAVKLGGGRVVRGFAALTTFGYAVPGAVVGIGTLLLFSAARRPGRGRGGHRWHRPAGDRLGRGHPVCLCRALPRPRLPGRRRVVREGVADHDAVGPRARRDPATGADPGAPAADAARGRGRARAGRRSTP